MHLLYKDENSFKLKLADKMKAAVIYPKSI